MRLTEGTQELWRLLNRELSALVPPEEVVKILSTVQLYTEARCLTRAPMRPDVREDIRDGMRANFILFHPEHGELPGYTYFRT